MIEKTFFFMSGLPRSGSTVLASILNQNPEIYVTPTSPLHRLLINNHTAWIKENAVRNLEPIQLDNICEGIVNSCWKHIPQNIIIDKHRAWAAEIETINAAFGQAKIIVNTRDIPSILASFISLNRNMPVGTGGIDETLLRNGIFLNDTNRADFMWNEYISKTWRNFKYGYDSFKEHLHIVEYDELCTNKKEVITGIYEFLDIPYFEHDLENIVNTTPEDDEFLYGLSGLHDVKPKLEKTSKNSRDILGAELHNKYKDMNLEFWRE